MITIISPAKNMGKARVEGLKLTTPDYMERAKVLVRELKKYNPWELESLFQVNPDLALKAFAYYQDWGEDTRGVAALLAFQGLQFKNIHPQDFTLEDFSFAKDHLRIVSGLYGLLKPTDEVHPYRLEMQTKISIGGKNLYQLWGDQLYKDLYKENVPVINLASKEYAKVIEPYYKPHDTFITIEFKVNSKGKLRTIGTYAKMARGQMVRYIIKNRLKDPQQLKDFSWNGYEFIPELSYKDKYVFIQRH